ncbi:ribosomal protein S18 acetylase RimI-like enzyme [Silvibacterium bohemicum]|uniref:Ribosomal protein S18 acetylase RimI-like enzyme n=1 Tax=Silvibacterium bohemicum TaxID=1577686 RepID=A0A841JNG1_9BACT|nr:GNAT family N-acetyltransferase [Silvibacterium bohemicum]MBB6142127.1 ribosomal protein S18 acetylase RimI-like enzyme [Silvibacterium bohemicum]
MDIEPTLTIQTELDQDGILQLRSRLVEYNRRFVPEMNYLPLLLSLKNAEQQLVGGLFGQMYHSWLFIDLLWVADDVRGRGYGRRLIGEAEVQAGKHGCHSIWLDTFSFQARGFYEKQGYAVFAELPNYPGEHTRYFLSKKLS